MKHLFVPMQKKIWIAICLAILLIVLAIILASVFATWHQAVRADHNVIVILHICLS